MPTPRHVTEVSKQASASTASGPSPGGWTLGTIRSVVSDSQGRYDVDLDSGTAISAELVIGADVAFGTRVWCVNAGRDSLIVALG